MSPNDDAARMMAEIQAANAELARRAVAPGWYHAALGLLMGGLIAVQGAPVPAIFGYYLVFGLGCWLLFQAYRRRTGMWINGYRAGRTRWVAIGLAVLFGLIMVSSVHLLRERGLIWAPWAGGAIAAVVVTLGGYVWEAAFRRDLRDGGSL
ncbi:MAG: hypothetical protein J7515_06505 [Caulobacter sp.]|nr:hypothetical protein [Caulobacter sp.]